MTRTPSKVTLLPETAGSLSHPDRHAEPGTLFVRGSNGGMSVAPDANFTLYFGRNVPEVHVCVGAGDKKVSRRQGLITREPSGWVLRNTGKAPIRLPGSGLVLGGDGAHLPVGYTPAFIVSAQREHLLEVRVAGRSESVAGWDTDRIREAETIEETRGISDEEKLVLVCLAQRYLRNEPSAAPLTWAQVAFELGELCPREKWSTKRAARVVEKVRLRISEKHGVRGLVEDEIPQPVGNALNHNLIDDLLVTTTIRRADLDMLRK
ncbi:hypothetical protein SRB5_25940 [Streptomyces sp. RB5]|uniref:FHA domain-containing protein n=1 Tax=Streptomyces smaragdinus TaxID=2585196 RepID=A0A7K0CG50_9ACTN|nr:hypothetical protein [Streptomyces smaragdinus]MQY12460.1 hypothetical protein [Streptomyces smaragdinus]